MTKEKQESNANDNQSNENQSANEQANQSQAPTIDVSELQKQIETLSKENENLKGTQSAQSKTLNEYKSKLDQYAKDGITPEQIGELQKTHENLNSQIERNKLVLDLASKKNIPSKALKFITGSTKEEIESSIDELISMIGEQEQKAKIKIASNDKESKEQKIDMKELAKNFVKNAKLIK